MCVYVCIYVCNMFLSVFARFKTNTPVTKGKKVDLQGKMLQIYLKSVVLELTKIKIQKFIKARQP